MISLIKSGMSSLCSTVPIEKLSYLDLLYLVIFIKIFYYVIKILIFFLYTESLYM
jgi:hypothetical protein